MKVLYDHLSILKLAHYADIPENQELQLVHSKVFAERHLHQYLLESLDLVFQLHLPGPAVEVGQTRGGGAAAARPLSLQLEQLQMLQLSTQVLDQLDRR